MDTESMAILAAIVIFFTITFGSAAAFSYHIDSSSCTDKATNYGAQVTSYSWLKNYCFVKMPNGTTVNLENYRDVNEQ